MRNINSLKNSSQFSGVYEGGKSFANRLLVVYVLPADDVVKLGISVSKKIGNSIVRHRITRLIRESYLNLRDQIPYGNYIVVIARSAARDKTQAEIEEAMKQLLKKHKLLGKESAEKQEENEKKNSAGC